MNYSQVLQSLGPFMEVVDQVKLTRNLDMLQAGTAKVDVSLVPLALGITYHEMCVLGYLKRHDASYASYAQKALDQLELARADAPQAALPILDAYATSARSLVAAVKRNPFGLLGVIRRYNQLIRRDAAVCYCADFLRASLLENLPNLFGGHAQAATSLNRILAIQQERPEYCPPKIVSFCYFGLAGLAKDGDSKRQYLARSIAEDSAGDGAAIMAQEVLDKLGAYYG